jgi:hypothetical protein
MWFGRHRVTRVTLAAALVERWVSFAPGSHDHGGHMTILWLAQLARLSSDVDVITDLRRKIVEQIRSVATWKPRSPVLERFSPSVAGNTRVAWTGTIPFREIPNTDVLVYFVDKNTSLLMSDPSGSPNADGRTLGEFTTDAKTGKLKPISSRSEVFIDRVDPQLALGLFSGSKETMHIDRAAAAFGAAALHEAMHNKMDQVRGDVTGKWLHAHGGGDVASEDIKKAFEMIDLSAKVPQFRIKANGGNRLLWNAHMDHPVPQGTRVDFDTEITMFR